MYLLDFTRYVFSLIFPNIVSLQAQAASVQAEFAEMRAVIDTIKLDRLTAAASDSGFRVSKPHWEGFSALSEGSEPIVGQGADEYGG